MNNNVIIFIKKFSEKVFKTLNDYRIKSDTEIQLDLKGLKFVLIIIIILLANFTNNFTLKNLKAYLSKKNHMDIDYMTI